MYTGTALIAAVGCLAAGVQSALHFHLSPFVATDIRIPSTSHSIKFTVSNPTAVYEQGGSAPRNCSISWSGSRAPTCYTQCAGDGYPYYARVTPGTYQGAYNVSLDILEYYIYQNSALNNATVKIVEGHTKDYFCSRGGQSTVCTFKNRSGVNSPTLDTNYGVSQPTDVCKQSQA